MDKDGLPSWSSAVKHPMYGKVMVRSKKYHAHNDGNGEKAGIRRDRRNPSGFPYQDLGCDQCFGKGCRCITKVLQTLAQ